MADEIGGEAASLGLDVLWGRCWEGGGAPLYWPWTQILRAHLRRDDAHAILRDLGPGSELIPVLLPELRLSEAEEHASVDSEDARFRLFDAITRLLVGASRDKPLMLVLDDLHLADHPTLLLLGFVARELRSARLFVYATYRVPETRKDSTAAATLSELGREATTLSLRGLTEGEVARLIQQSVSDQPSEELLSLVHRATEGNPLFVWETIRLLVAEGRLTDPALHRETTLPVSEGVRQTIRRRLEIVSEEGREMLTRAAVLGHQFDLRALQAVTGRSLPKVLELLAEPIGAGLLVDPDGAVGSYRFAHGLVRDALYEELPPGRRAQLHLEMGTALEKLHEAHEEGHLSELAHHFTEAVPAGGAAKAVHFGVRAGDRATRLFANEEAVGRYRMALRAAEFLEDQDPRTLAGILLSLGKAENLAGELDAARETFQRAADIAKRIGAPEILARAAVGYGREMTASGIVDRALVSLLTAALEQLPADQNELRIDVMTRLAMELSYSEEAERATSLSREAVELARQIGDPQALAYAIEADVYVSAGPDNLTERLEAGREIERLAREGGSEIGIATGRAWRLTALLEQGDTLRFDEELEAYAADADRHRLRAHSWYAAALEATRLLAAGRFEEGQARAIAAKGIGEPARGEEAIEYFVVQRITQARELGVEAELIELEERLVRLAHRFPAVAAFPAALARLYLDLGREREARRELDQLVHRLPDLRRNTSWIAALSLMAETASALGDREACRELLGRLEPYAHHAVLFDWAMACYGSVARYLGLLADALGQYDDAAAHFRSAVDMNRRMGLAPYLAHAQEELGRSLIARDGPGDREEALDQLTAALATYRELRMVPHEKRVVGFFSDIGAGPVEGETTEGAPAAGRGVFRREGEYWSIAFGQDAFRLRDAKGLRYLARLLAEPGRELHAMDLLGGAAAASRPSGQDVAQAGLGVSEGHTGAVLDATAKEAYRRRLEDLQDELDEAERWSDSERAAKARQEIDFLAHELSAAMGLGGRDRHGADVSERARVNVTKAIRSALDRIEANSAALGEHLSRAVRTGTFCIYDPDPRARVAWQF